MLFKGLAGGLLFIGPVYIGSIFGGWGIVVAIFAILGVGFALDDRKDDNANMCGNCSCKRKQ